MRQSMASEQREKEREQTVEGRLHKGEGGKRERAFGELVQSKPIRVQACHHDSATEGGRGRGREGGGDAAE